MGLVNACRDTLPGEVPGEKNRDFQSGGQDVTINWFVTGPGQPPQNQFDATFTPLSRSPGTKTPSNIAETILHSLTDATKTIGATVEARTTKASAAREKARPEDVNRMC